MKIENILKSMLVMEGIILLLIVVFLWTDLVGVIEREIAQPKVALLCFFTPFVLFAGVGSLWLFSKIDKSDNE